MANTSLLYAADEAITASNWDSLVADDWATLPAFDNTTNLYVDVLIGGEIAFNTTTGTLAAGESFDIYVAARYAVSDANSYSGGLDDAFGANDATIAEDTEFTPLNLFFLGSVSIRATTPDTTLDYMFGPWPVAPLFGGQVPQNFILVGHNNTGATMGTGCAVNAVGLKYSTA